VGLGNQVEVELGSSPVVALTQAVTVGVWHEIEVIADLAGQLMGQPNGLLALAVHRRPIPDREWLFDDLRPPASKVSVGTGVTGVEDPVRMYPHYRFGVRHRCHGGEERREQNRERSAGYSGSQGRYRPRNWTD
jgi:hypothetical protein